jgi:DNA-binding transcriptional LysR family regulator
MGSASIAYGTPLHRRAQTGVVRRLMMSRTRNGGWHKHGLLNGTRFAAYLSGHPMRIDFLGLQAFLSIAERGSFLRAAAHLNLSQTALSHRIKKLEEDLGLQLLARTTRQVALTPAGLELLPTARRIIGELTDSIAALRERGRQQQERIAIGCLPTIAAYHLPRVLKEFNDLHPGIAIKVFDNSAGEIATLVQSGQAEFGVTIIAMNIWDLEATPLITERFVVLCTKDNAFARRRFVTWSNLEDQALIRISPQAGNRALIDDALGNRRDTLNWRYEVQHLQTAVGMVHEKLGIAIVPNIAVKTQGTAGLVAIPLRNPGVSRTVGIVVKRGLPVSRPAQVLIDMIQKYFKTAR